MFNSYLKFKLCYFSRISVTRIAPRGGFYFAILAPDRLELSLTVLETALLTTYNMGQYKSLRRSLYFNLMSFLLIQS